MNTSKNIPAKFLAENCVESRVKNFAHKHGREILPNSREVCKITPTTHHYTYKGGQQRESRHFAFKCGVQYNVWLYRNTDGSFTDIAFAMVKKPFWKPESLKRLSSKKNSELTRKNSVAKPTEPAF